MFSRNQWYITAYTHVLYVNVHNVCAKNVSNTDFYRLEGGYITYARKLKDWFIQSNAKF